MKYDLGSLVHLILKKEIKRKHNNLNADKKGNLLPLIIFYFHHNSYNTFKLTHFPYNFTFFLLFDWLISYSLLEFRSKSSWSRLRHYCVATRSAYAPRSSTSLLVLLVIIITSPLLSLVLIGKIRLYFKITKLFI